MNSNNWLSFPLSPTHSSLPLHLHTSQSNQFTLGLVNDTSDHPFQIQDWNLINSHGGDEVPKMADFLGVNKHEIQPDLSAFNQIPATSPDYLFSNNTLLQGQNSAGAVPDDHDSHENFGNLQSLSLTMGGGKDSNVESIDSNTAIVEASTRRSVDTFGQRTSIYRGVTRHRWTGRYEAHLWDNSCRREGQSRKGRQVYLGGYDKEEKAARSYDLAAIKYWGTSTTTNFPINNYEREIEEMKHMTRQEFVASLRRKSSGFSRGASMYRGVTRHHQHGRWQARIGRVAGNKDLYLGTFSTEEEAAEAYDIAAIKFRGLNAVTNFDMNRYDVKSILESNTLPIGGGAAKRLKESQAIEASRKTEEMKALGSSFYNGSSSSFQGYPLMSSFEQPQPLLALPSQQNPQYIQDSQFYQNYVQYQLHQHSTSSLLHSNQDTQFHQIYLHNHPALLHGFMGSSSSMVESNEGSSSGYSGGYLANGMVMGANSTTVNAGDVGTSNLGLVKVDYDMASGGGYDGWSADSIQGPNPGVFTMWNDTWDVSRKGI